MKGRDNSTSLVTSGPALPTVYLLITVFSSHCPGQATQAGLWVYFSHSLVMVLGRVMLSPGFLRRLPLLIFVLISVAVF